MVVPWSDSSFSGRVTRCIHGAEGHQSRGLTARSLAALLCARLAVSLSYNLFTPAVGAWRGGGRVTRRRRTRARPHHICSAPASFIAIWTAHYIGNVWRNPICVRRWKIGLLTRVFISRWKAVAGLPAAWWHLAVIALLSRIITRVLLWQEITCYQSQPEMGLTSV